MKKNDIFTFTAPNGVEVTGVCLYPIFKGTAVTTYVCYAQNRLFTMLEESTMTDKGIEKAMKYHEVIVDYAVLPDYDALLDRYNDIEVAQAETQSGM
jgi:hypothetical protein